MKTGTFQQKKQIKSVLIKTVRIAPTVLFHPYFLNALSDKGKPYCQFYSPDFPLCGCRMVNNRFRCTQQMLSWLRGTAYCSLFFSIVRWDWLPIVQIHVVISTWPILRALLFTFRQCGIVPLQQVRFSFCFLMWTGSFYEIGERRCLGGAVVQCRTASLLSSWNISRKVVNIAQQNKGHQLQLYE